MLHAISHTRHSHAELAGTLLLDHRDRHLRRKLLTTCEGDKLMVDLPEPVLLAHGDALVLEDGRIVAILATEEDLYEVRPGAAVPLHHLAWHLGNRHVAAQIDEDRILIRRDHVIREMVEGLGATVAEVSRRFQPVHGAYHHHGEAHGHGEGHGHHHHHD
jgi:urease accessory protein